MTVRHILQCIARRWYVFLAVVISIVALTAFFSADGGSYVTKTTVTFTAPEPINTLGKESSSDSGVIAFASAVATEINGGRPAQAYSSSDAPYYGAGVREGVMVSLRNNGNQWVASYPSAIIDIQIVGRTREWVQVQQHGILADIASVTEAQQDSIVTSPSARITAEVDPLSRQIVEIAPSRTALALAMAAMGAVAVLLGASLAVLADRAFRRAASWRRSSVRTRRHVGESLI